MLRDLFVIDPPATRNEIETEKGGLLPGTGSWIFDPPEEKDGELDLQHPGKAYSIFSEWWTDDESQVLWIRGDPGKGKTILAISLIDEIRRRLGIQQQPNFNNHTLAYFFCVHNNEEKNHTAYIVRSLLWQVLSEQPRLATPFRQKYDKQKKEHLLSTSAAALHSLLEVFDRTLNDPRFHAYFVIDALDECSEESRDILKNYLKSLRTSKDEKVRSKIKWLVTVRNDIELWGGALTVSLEENSKHVNKAVDQYVGDRVKELALAKEYDCELRASVEKYLRERANGTFLWAALACKRAWGAQSQIS